MAKLIAFDEQAQRSFRRLGFLDGVSRLAQEMSWSSRQAGKAACCEFHEVSAPVLLRHHLSS